MPAKLDVKKEWKQLYQPPKGRFVEVEVPALRYVMVDGAGNPNTAEAYQTALQWLYSVSYGMKFLSKQSLARDYVVPPLEGLWWADDPAAFTARDKDTWQWTMMIMVPDFVPDVLYEAGLEKAQKKLGAPPPSLGMNILSEGLCLQTMHIGSYDDEAPVLEQLHSHVMPDLGMTFNGHHHEIYLSDPRKTAAHKLKTVLRQPVKRLAP